MRILQLVQKPQRRGAEVFAHHLSQELRCQDHYVHTVYLYPYRGVGALPFTQATQCLDGIEQHSLERVIGIHPYLLRRLLRIIDDIQPDIVQVNGARTVKYGALTHQLRRRHRWALIYRNIGNPQDWMNSVQHRLFYKHLVMPQLDGIVGVSRTTLENLQKIYHLPIPLRNIPRGVDPKALQPQQTRDGLRSSLQTANNAPVVLYVGSLTPEKRLDRLLSVFQQVCTTLPDAHLWLVGDGPLRRELTQKADSLGLSTCVHFTGIQSDVASYMAAADLLALTSDTEGLPGVILEAGLLNLPAVATNVGGVAESVIDGKTGVLVDPNNEAGLANALLMLLQYPAQRSEMGRQAQQWVSAHFTIERITQQYLAFYAEVLMKVRK